MRSLMIRLRIRFACVLLLLLVGSALPLAPAQPAAAQEATPPQNLLINTYTSDWAVAGPRLIWLTYPPCPEFAGSPVTIGRVRTTGSAARFLFSRNDPREPGACNPYKLNSNIVADESFVYFVDGDHLVRLSVEANPGDPPQQVSGIFFDYIPNPNSVVFNDPVQLAITNDRIVASQSATCGFCIQGTTYFLISKADGSFVSNFISTEVGKSPSFDGKYFYYKTANNLLRRFIPGEGAQPVTINVGGPVGDYVAEGETTLCRPGPIQLNCTTTDYVFYIVEDTIMRYNGLNGQTAGIYTASRPISQAARLNGLALANRGASFFFGRSLFFFDKRFTPCPIPPGCFVTPSTDRLRVIGRDGGEATDLYFRETDTAHTSQKLTSDGANIYWAEQDVEGPFSPSTIKRLPADAAGLPKINLTVTGLEITQGIQRENNGVPLVQLRPTFVRVFARATGQSVPGVTAQLEVSASGLGTTTLGAVNRDASGVRTSRIRVLVNPSRGVTNDSFLFELPWEYTRAPDLRLRATINPFGVPLEPTLADNTISAGPFAFQPTPRLNVIFVEFPFRLNNTNYRPQGTLANVGWINRVYPLGASIGNEGWNHGLNYRIWEVNDAGLAARVNRQSPECDAYVKRKKDGTIEKDDREFCASDYVNGLLRDLRSRRSVPEGTFLYGEIPDTGVAGQFPRGQEGGSSVSSGPDGASWNGFYAGHEIGHSLGLGHPKTADGSCGLSGSDPQPPYTNGWIGTADSTILGFDSSSRSVLAGASNFDMMAYCQPQWISDVNYERIYNRLSAGLAAREAAPRQASGDYLSVYGSLDATGDSAAVTLIQRLAGTLAVPPQTPGDYALRLLDAQGATLAEQPFAPEESANGDGRQSFGLAVPFAPGTREARIVKLSTNTTLYSRQLSAEPPTIGDVALQNAPDPFAGAATLGWAATDPDNDGLTFDVLYSADGGASFQPLALGVGGSSVSVDAGRLDGTSVIFRVVASDGVQAAEADSAAYTLAARPPQPRILNPADGTALEWGQLVNLRGEAADRQDGFVATEGLSWSNQNGPLGTGPQLALDDLPVGANVITLTATNSAGLAASTSLRLTVGDDLAEPGPLLAAEPASLSWNIAPGATQALTATLALDNASGSALSWSATSDAPWLTLDASSGATPQTLLVSADPQGFAADTTARATITLRALDNAGQPFQTLSVPVAVYVGNPGYGEAPGTLASKEVRLPIVAR
jgi:hypothetical protein